MRYSAPEACRLGRIHLQRPGLRRLQACLRIGKMKLPTIGIELQFPTDMRQTPLLASIIPEDSQILAIDSSAKRPSSLLAPDPMFSFRQRRSTAIVAIVNHIKSLKPDTRTCEIIF
jgi:hypothetical protein